MATVTYKNVNKVFPPNIVAVKDFNLEIKDKEFLVLVGPSGCGKSTSLRMVAGLEEITSGEIYIDDRLINYIPAKNRDIAMVFQNYALYPHMRVYDNFSFGLKLRGYSKEEIDSRVKEAASLLGIENLLDRLPKELSGGQKQRVAVGRTIVRKPKVFLFDEPLSNLDAKLRVQMRAELIKLHHRLQVTIIYVTHDQIEAMTMGDRIVVMLDGEIQQIADPFTLYEKPVNKFVAGFMGSPPMNFIEGKITKEEENLFFQSSTFRLPLPEDRKEDLLPYQNREVALGIRPENILIEEKDNSIMAVVEVVEPIGNETFVHFRLGPENTFLVRLPSISSQTAKIKIDEKLPLFFIPKKIHLFDKLTEKAI